MSEKSHLKDMKVMLYGDTIELLFDEVLHLYTINGKKVDGTTSALGVISKPALMYWAVNQAIEHLQGIMKPGKSYDEMEIRSMLLDAKGAHRKKKETAADMGTFVHKWCEDWIAGLNPEVPVNPELKNATDQFLKWVSEHHVEFLLSEKVVYSKLYNYAGTMDFLAKIDGKLTVGDFKTSSGIWDEYFFQVAAYQQAYEEEYPEAKIDGQMIIRIGKDASFEIKEISSRDEYILNREAFVAALILYRRLKHMKEIKMREESHA